MLSYKAIAVSCLLGLAIAKPVPDESLNKLEARKVNCGVVNIALVIMTCKLHHVNTDAL